MSDEYDRVRKDLEDAIRRNTLRKQNIKDLAIQDAIIYKLGNFKLEHLKDRALLEYLKDRALLEIKGDLQYFFIDGDLLLIIEDNFSFREPKITKLYKENFTEVKTVKIPPYRLEYLDRLIHTRKPFASRIANCIRSLDSQSDMMIERTLVEGLISLEKLNEKYILELEQYKQRFGELK